MEASLSPTDFSIIPDIHVEHRTIQISLTIHVRASVFRTEDSIYLPGTVVPFIENGCILVNLKFVELHPVFYKRTGIGGLIEHLFTVKLSDCTTANADLDLGFFIRKACVNLYSTDDTNLIGLICDVRKKMGMDSDTSEIIAEVDRIVRDTIFTVRNVRGKPILLPEQSI
jgi:hypothetical protein